MKTVSVALMCILFLGADLLAEELHSGGIRKPKQVSDGIRRPVAPKSSKVALNGKLVWVKDWLYLQTPSGRKYQLSSKKKDVEGNLVDLAGKGSQYVELFGTLSEKKPSVDEIEFSTKTDPDDTEEPRFVVSFNIKGSDWNWRTMENSLGQIEGIDYVYALRTLPGVIIKTDFSRKHLEEVLKASEFGDVVKPVERDSKLQALRVERSTNRLD